MLRQRVLSQLLGGALFAVLIFAGFYILITQNYQRLEQENLELERNRILNSLDMTIERLDEVIQGWAASGYIEYTIATPGAESYRNLGANIISGSFDINEVAYFDQSGTFIVGRETDREREISDTPLDEHSPFIASAQSQRLYDHTAFPKGRRGLAMMHGDLHMVSTHPNANYDGTAGKSSIVAATHFSDEVMSKLEDLVEMDLEIIPLSEFSKSLENAELVQELKSSPSAAAFVQISDEQIYTYSLVDDYTGQPGFVLRATSNRNFFVEASRTLLWFGMCASLAFICLVVWFLIILDKSVLRRLHSLNKAIVTMEHTGRLDTMVPSGHDEIGAVGTAFNRLLLKFLKSQDALNFQANHDSLTGVMNRRQFEEELDKALDAVQNKGVNRHLVFLDLDRFKIVNDNCGHMAGDAVLQELSILIQEQLDKKDVFARIGGDEFGIILPDCDSASARLIIENIREVVSRFRYVYEGRQFVFGISSGLLDLSSPVVDCREIALTLADSACRIAKNSGRNRTHEHHVADEQLSEQLRQTRWVNRITDALEKNRFVLYYQKIFSSSASQKRLGAELLIRMLDEDDSIIPPGAFIPSAERYQLMGQLDRWVIDTFLHWYSKNSASVSEIDFFTINLSGQSLVDSDFLDFLQSLIKDSGVPPEKICFEITETSIIENLNSGKEFIKVMKALGCRFALDDFGAGMSSFVYLRDLPVDMVKIEGTFCQNMAGSEIDKAMVKSIIEISKLMQLEVVAECVENDEVSGLCVDMGVDYEQGFLLHKPELLLKP
ncbi:MAG: EAL domain-containing protein [Pseudohongiellaceae bacterium]|nr:EAL domain-containing protein [Pseudohongiellaceae bacterium]